METEPRQHHMVLIVLSGALLAALVVAVVIYFVPSSGTLPVQDSADQTALNTGTSPDFNTAVLQRAEFRALDTSLFTRGLLPVQPPTGTGKANLFQ